MHIFDENEKLVKYDTPEEIINHFIKVRYGLYIERKKYMLEQLKRETMLLSNRARFIMDNLNDKIDLRKKKNKEVSLLLKQNNYDTIDNDNTYKYLVKMPMDSVTIENVNKHIKDRDDKLKELKILEKTKEMDLWIKELNELKKYYIENN